MFDYPSVGDMARHVHGLLAQQQGVSTALLVPLASIPVQRAAPADQVIQVSIAARLPQLLQVQQAGDVSAAAPGLGADVITAVPALRWDVEAGKLHKVQFQSK